MPIISPGFKGRRRPGGEKLPPGQYLVTDFPVLSAGPTPRVDTGQVGAADQDRERARRTSWDWAAVPAAAQRERHRRPALRDQVVQVRHALARCLAGHAAGRRGDLGRVRAGPVLRRVHHQPAARRPAGRQGLDRLPLRRPGPDPRARRPGPAAGPAPVPVEVGQVGQRHRPDGPRTSRGSGSSWATTTTGTRGASSGTGATDLAGRAPSRPLRDETPTARTIALDVPGWRGHSAGQHVDVRLTAEDGYSTQRSYSIASAPDGERLELTVQRVTDGEVSPYLAEVLKVGDPLELRGPIGGWFVWDPADPAPALLVAGGSGIVPLMAMIRARGAGPQHGAVPAGLLGPQPGPDHLRPPSWPSAPPRATGSA